MTISEQLLTATGELCDALSGLSFSEPVTHVYNPLLYARRAHASYVTRFGNSEKRVLFMGMNPGPWGMAQTGVPFGEIPAVRDWMGIEEPVDRPEVEHPKRPVEGFACEKSEVSGRRLWGLFSERYPEADSFFAKHYVANYCPLVWMEASSRNRTPDKLPASEMEPVSAACDQYIAKHLELLRPEWCIGVGAYAETCLKRVIETVDLDPSVGRILHPSPASPVANKQWPGKAIEQMGEMGLW
ncbi:MAG: uracil-DNA glycosylase family protein [Verrucomicrobiota bacterium]